MSTYTTVKFKLESGSISVYTQLTLLPVEWFELQHACKTHLTSKIGDGTNHVFIMYDTSSVCSAKIVNGDTVCYIDEEADLTLEKMCKEALGQL